MQDYPDYSSTAIRTVVMNYKYKYWYYALKVLCQYYGYKCYNIPDRSLKKAVIYPNIIFELYEYITDRYWNELSDDGETWNYVNVPLAKFIIDKVDKENLDNKYRNK